MKIIEGQRESARVNAVNASQCEFVGDCDSRGRAFHLLTSLPR